MENKLTSSLKKTASKRSLSQSMKVSSAFSPEGRQTLPYEALSNEKNRKKQRASDDNSHLIINFKLRLSLGSQKTSNYLFNFMNI